MNDKDSQCLRTPPTERFEGDEHRIDLNAAMQQLHAEHVSTHGRRQITVFKRDAVTIALFSFDADGGLAEHKADGIAMITCLASLISVTTPTQTHEISENMMVVLDPGVPHAVQAHEPSRMLLTLCLSPPPAQP